VAFVVIVTTVMILGPILFWSPRPWRGWRISRSAVGCP